MRIGVVLCGIVGHRWRVDEQSTEHEAVISCDRCGRREIAPAGTAFGRRIGVKTGADRTIGPFGGGRR